MKNYIKKILISLMPSIAGWIIQMVIENLSDEVRWLGIAVGVAGSLFIFIVYVIPDFLRPFDKGRQTGIILLSLSSFFVIGLMIWEQMLGPKISGQLIDQDQVRILIRNQRWITYDPLQFNPYSGTTSEPESIDQELGWLSDAGFTGIITFSSRDDFQIIPELAKRHDLRVIMGVWDPTDKKEIQQAIAAKDFIDAYVVGHNGLNVRYTYNQLVQTMQFIRFRTRLPVSTTEKIGEYVSNPRLLEIGDWVFPDVHVSVQQNDTTGGYQYYADAIRDSQETISMANVINDMEERKGKPILLKMVTYPMDGISNASFAEQSKFFIAILDGRRDVIPDIPPDVSISVHSAFDTPWKTTWPFYEWDPYTGLFDVTGAPRPVVAEVVQRLP